MREHVTPVAEVPGPGGPPAITGVATSVAALVAPAASGPRHRPLRVTSPAEVDDGYGAADSPLRRAASDFFGNGGSVALAVRAETSGEALAALEALGSGERFGLLWVAPEVSGTQVLRHAHALCEERHAMLLVDADDDGLMPDGLGRSAAVFHPAVTDTAGAPRPCVPAVAGVVARTDAARGVWKAPAGTAADLRGVGGVARLLTDSDLGHLNERHVNGLRVLPEGSVVIWGSRTASTDPEWRYVPVRRLAMFVESSVDAGLQWAAFEPNDERLWARARQSVEAFLDGLWRQGALAGTGSQQAYFVRCDRTTMTQTDLDHGRLVMLVGIAPVRPAEGLGGVAGGVAEQRGRSRRTAPITLTQGSSVDPDFLAWAGRCLGAGTGEDLRRDLVVRLADHTGRVVADTAVSRARVAALAGGDGVLDRLVLEHEGLRRLDPPGR
jgi:hypothetical protein